MGLEVFEVQCTCRGNVVRIRNVVDINQDRGRDGTRDVVLPGYIDQKPDDGQVRVFFGQRFQGLDS